MLILPTKGPSEVVRYTLEWADRLGADTLSGSPTVTVTGATKVTQSNDSHSVTVKVSGGSAGTVAKIEASSLTTAGDTIDDVAVFLIGFDAVTLAEAKAQQRITSSDEDQLLTAFLRAAIGAVEAQTGKKLTPTIVTQTADGFPSSCGAVHPYPAPLAASASRALRLWKGPVSSILSIDYDDANGVPQTLSSFRLVEGPNAQLLPAYGESWPTTARGPGTVRLTYVAGYDVGELPPELAQAALLMFGHFNANREAAIADVRAAAVELPLGVQWLVAPYCAPGIA